MVAVGLLVHGAAVRVAGFRVTGVGVLALLLVAALRELALRGPLLLVGLLLVRRPLLLVRPLRVVGLLLLVRLLRLVAALLHLVAEQRAVVGDLGLQSRAALLALQRTADGVQRRGAALGPRLVARVVEAQLGGGLHAGRLDRLLLGHHPGDREVVLGGVAATTVGDGVRQHDQRGGAGLLARGAQLDADAVAGGQSADHEQTHALRDRGVDGRRVGQLVVDVREVLGGQADALVVDLDHHAAVGQTGRGDADLGVRGGERGGVLQQLGQQVHEVGDGEAVDLGVRDAAELDALVGLHLGGGGAEHVDQRNRLVPVPAGLLARENQQVLAVAAHTGGQVVQAEEVLQLVRVGLVVLQVGDEGQLALDQRLVAAREVGEDRVDVAPEQCLLGGESDGLLVHLVEGAGDLADLVPGGDGDGLDTGVNLAGIGARELGDQRRQALLGHVEGRGAQAAHVGAHGTGHSAGHEEGDDQREDHDRRVDDRVARGVRGDGLGLFHRVVGEVLLDRPVGVELTGGYLQPRVGVHALRLQLRGRGARHDGGRHLVLLVRLGLGGQRGLQALDVLVGGAGLELAAGDVLEEVVRGEGGQQRLAVRGGARLDQQVRADGALQRLGGLGQRDGVDRATVGGDVARAQAQLVGEGHERTLDGAVAVLGLRALQGRRVRGRTQLGQHRLRGTHVLEAALEARGVRHLLDGLVERGTCLVRRGARLLDDRVLGVAVEQRLGGEVALVDDGVGVRGRGPHGPRGLGRVRRLQPRVDGRLHVEAAEDQCHEHRDQQDRVQPGPHTPVAGRESAAAGRSGGGGGFGHVGRRHRCARRRGEVTPRVPRLLRGARLSSPHSTNNLSASAPDPVPFIC